MPPPPPISTLFPYTTLFRSLEAAPDSPLEPRVRPLLDRQDADPLEPRPLSVHRHAAERTLSAGAGRRSEEHTSELQSHSDLVCRLLLEKKKKIEKNNRKYLL